MGTVHQATIDLCEWLRRVLKPLRLGRQTASRDSQELTLETSTIGESANERPVVSTFAAQLPFPLRLESGSVFTYELARTYADPKRAAAVFPGSPWVRIRIYNQPLTQAPRIRPALQELYQTEVDIDDWLPDGAYVQWVSLETPTLLLSDEPPEDGAFAFHRCLHTGSICS